MRLFEIKMAFKGIWTRVFHFWRKKYVFSEKKAVKKARFEPTIFQSQVKCYTNWAIQPGDRNLQHLIRFIDDNSNLSIKKVIQIFAKILNSFIFPHHLELPNVCLLSTDIMVPFGQYGQYFSGFDLDSTAFAIRPLNFVNPPVPVSFWVAQV